MPDQTQSAQEGRSAAVYEDGEDHRGAGDVPVLSVLMPVYNERATVSAALAQVCDTDFGAAFEVLVVDDGSTDGTGPILREAELPANVVLLHHERNQGKGAAVRTALGAARGEYSAIFDADLEYDPADISNLLPPLREGLANAAFGIRAFDGYSSHSFLFVLGNKVVTLATNVLFNCYLHDLMTCHKVIRTEVARSLELRARGFEIEPEITARLLQRGERIFEMPVHYKARATEEGKKLTAVDGFRVLWTLIRCRVSGPSRRAAGSRVRAPSSAR